GRETGCDPRLAGAALRQLDQLQADDRARGVAAVARAACARAGRGIPRAPQDRPLMGWAFLLLLIAAAFGVLWASRVGGGLLTAALAALMLGASGYALQGRPTLAGSPAKGSAGQEVQSLTEARHAFFGNFSAEESWLRMSEALASHGNTEDAVNILQNAVRRYPADGQLWIGLGNALVDHSRGLTPPAELAYKRAAQMS